MAGKNALGSTKVRKHVVECVNIYEVTEYELNLFESGGQFSIMMDIAISLLSVAVTCIITLLTTTFNKLIIKNVFLFVAIISVVVGVVLLLLSFNSRKSVAKIVSNIKSRKKPEE